MMDRWDACEGENIWFIRGGDILMRTVRSATASRDNHQPRTTKIKIKIEPTIRPPAPSFTHGLLLPKTMSSTAFAEPAVPGQFDDAEDDNAFVELMRQTIGCFCETECRKHVE